MHYGLDEIRVSGTGRFVAVHNLPEYSPILFRFAISLLSSSRGGCVSLIRSNVVVIKRKNSDAKQRDSYFVVHNREVCVARGRVLSSRRINMKYSMYEE